MSYVLHRQNLDNLCRICGKSFGKNTKYTCSKYLQILEVLSIDLSNDSEEIHPQSFCNSCYLAAKRISSSSCNIVRRPVRQQLNWLAHSEVNCNVCKGKGRGRPKNSHIGGRPSLLTAHIRSVACTNLPSFTLSQIVDKTYTESIICTLCKSAISEPVEIHPCKSLICCSCLEGHLNKELNTFECPGCSENHVKSITSVTKLSPIAEKMISNMMVKFNKCYNPVKLLKCKESCDHHGDTSCSNLLEVVKRPLEVQPTTIEKQVVTNVVARLLHQNDNAIITLPTGGRVSY